MFPLRGIRISFKVWRNLPLSGSRVNPSTPDPMVSTRTVVALNRKALEMRRTAPLKTDTYNYPNDRIALRVLTKIDNIPKQLESCRPAEMWKCPLSTLVAFCKCQKYFRRARMNQYSSTHRLDQRLQYNHRPQMQNPSIYIDGTNIVNHKKGKK